MALSPTLTQCRALPRRWTAARVVPLAPEKRRNTSRLTA